MVLETAYCSSDHIIIRKRKGTNPVGSFCCVLVKTHKMTDSRELGAVVPLVSGNGEKEVFIRRSSVFLQPGVDGSTS